MFRLPSIPTLKIWAIGILTLGISFLYALMKTKDAAVDRDRLAAEKAARKTEVRVNKATIEGLQNEADSKDNRNYDDDATV